MPGPGNRKQVKSKSATRSHESEGQVRFAGIDNAEGWSAVVNLLCDVFKLPDLTSRKGLKQVHAKFDPLFAKIEHAYKSNPQNYKLRGGIIGIFSKMCVDSMLRDRLFEKGVLGMITPLLEIDDTRHLALHCLSIITHHSGSKARVEIAKNANVLARLIQDLPEDEKVAELAVSTLAHALAAVTGGLPEPTDPVVFKSIDMVEVLKSTLEAVKRPHSDPQVLMDHAIKVVCMSSPHAVDAFKAYPPAIDFMVAGLRSNDWVTRSICLGGVLRLHQFEAEENPPIFDRKKLLSGEYGRLPDHLVALEMEYGHERCDMYLMAKALAETASILIPCVATGDFYTLGLKQAELMLQTDFILVPGIFEIRDPVTGSSMNENAGVSFPLWAASLSNYSSAIRRSGKPNEADFADILDLKKLIVTSCIPDAVALAHKCIERNPQQAFFYYVISLGDDHVQALRAAKKGLKCKLLTPFLKWQLMLQAVILAANMGVSIIQSMPDSRDKRWQEGIAFLSSAYDDAKLFMEGAPPDNHYMDVVACWYILLHMILLKDLSSDLHEIKRNLERLHAADEFNIFMGIPPPKTDLRLAQQTAVEHYPAAIKEFSRVFQVLYQAKIGEGHVVRLDRGKLEDDLTAWFNDMKFDDGTMMHVGAGCSGGSGQVKVTFDQVTLYRCSWCSNTSAILSKCGGCSEARYCDRACQKLHWEEHKKTCKRQNVRK
ncbi:hypothetical protein JR316_0010188 [Psilocybe cubensis]|uniref:Uncharacterized protein n=2 Tax=Psilocybe cubensis TaxID=181762 RepID=A0ACB8GQE8_PSICU|nr:hypothetical protein JR316_0010188 [Psilocybe cubensis]KAH9477955.1 hypothetical protein JR316_0010188 [Psilocybe cubensis]